MRAHRKEKPLQGEAKLKAKAMSHACTYLKRGKIFRLPCRDCGSSIVKMHHPDYSKPLEVVWLCRRCLKQMEINREIPKELWDSGCCPNCFENVKKDGSRLCEECNKKYSKKYRKPYSALSEDQKLRSNARAYFNSHVSRGLIQKQPCSVCGSSLNIEAHHENYSKPLDVIWLCRKHHKELHLKSVSHETEGGQNGKEEA